MDFGVEDKFHGADVGGSLSVPVPVLAACDSALVEIGRVVVVAHVNHGTVDQGVVSWAGAPVVGQRRKFRVQRAGSRTKQVVAPKDTRDAADVADQVVGHTVEVAADVHVLVVVGGGVLGDQRVREISQAGIDPNTTSAIGGGVLDHRDMLEKRDTRYTVESSTVGSGLVARESHADDFMITGRRQQPTTG